jgi:hypothetical protein
MKWEVKKGYTIIQNCKWGAGVRVFNGPLSTCGTTLWPTVATRAHNMIIWLYLFLATPVIQRGDENKRVHQIIIKISSSMIN